MKDNNKDFINLYAKLEEALKNFYQNYRGSIVLFHIEKLKNSYREKDKKRAIELDRIRILRNFLVHEADIVGEDAFVINSSVLSFLESEIELLMKPLTANDICTKLDNLFYATVNANVKDTIEVMINKGYSHIPILDKNMKLLGVFSPNTLLAYIYNNDSTQIKGDSLIKDYIKHLDINNHVSDRYLFVDSNRPINQLIDIFEKREKNKRISMLFVTKNGDINEKIIGVITVYDVINNG